LVQSYTSGSGNNKYRFTGKERDTETNYDYFGARYYDSDLGRWLSVDPLVGKYPGLSPYNYVLNNPINSFDPNGESPFFAQLLFFLRHPIISTQIGTASTFSTNLSSNAARFAYNSGLATGKGSSANAFRHTMWQATISSAFGSNIAKEAGDAHEENPQLVSDYENSGANGFNSLDEADSYVDLKNNEIGRSMGEQNGETSPKNNALAVLDYFRNGGLWTVEKNGKKYIPKINKLSSEEYEKIKKKISEKLNRFGFKKDGEQTHFTNKIYEPSN